LISKTQPFVAKRLHGESPSVPSGTKGPQSDSKSRLFRAIADFLAGNQRSYSTDRLLCIQLHGTAQNP
jgi:hypothetical protein